MRGNFRAWLAIVAALAACSDVTIAADGDLSVFLTPRFENVVTNAAVKFAEVADYKGRPQELFVDFYRPEGDSATNRPVAVLIHGGGFRTDGKRTQKYIVHFANELAKRGFVAASIDYRQREAADMPTAADELPAMKDAAADVLTALQWIRSHGGEYGYDPSSIFLVGGSAGGRIACAIACRENGDNGELPATDKFSTTDPPSSVASDQAADYSREGLVAAAILWGGPESEYRCFTVDDADLPCVFIHGTYDSLVPAEGSIYMQDALSVAGVPARLHLLNGFEHTLKETASGGGDAKPQTAQWIADFFVQAWQAKRSGSRLPDSVPEVRVRTGEKAVLSAPIGCSGFEPSWRWSCNGHDIPGADGATLAIGHATEDDAGLYEVTVLNPPDGWSAGTTTHIMFDRLPIHAAEYGSVGNDGKALHPKSLTVPVARVAVGAE